MAYARCKSSFAPEMSFGIAQSLFLMVPKEKITASSFEILLCLRNAHRVGNADNCMQMLRHDLQFMDLNAMFFRCFSDASFRKVLIVVLPEHFVAVFRAPLHVPEVVANRMLICCVLHVCLLARQSSRYHSHVDAWRSSARHHL